MIARTKRIVQAGTLVGLVCVMTAVSELAAAETPVSLAVLDKFAPPIPSPAPSYFSEQHVSLALRLHGVPACPDVAALLIQHSYRLDAELSRRQAFDCADLNDSTEAEAGDFSFAFVVPKVDRASRFDWRFVRCNGADDRCDALLTLPFTVYPRNLLDRLRRWAAEHVLVVRDPLGELQDFLVLNDIEFYERAVRGTPGAQVKTLIVRREARIEPADYEKYLSQGDVVLFRENVDTLPLIKVVDRGTRRLTTVELVLVSKLTAGPGHQRTFLDILDLPLNEEPIR